MTTATPKVDLAKQANTKIEPPAIKATYSGTFYKKISKDGHELVPFSKTVRWPYSAVQNEGFTPIGLFHRYKKKKLMNELGGADLREIHLTKVEGELPKIKSVTHKLDWMCDHAALSEFALESGEVSYVHVDLKSNERETRKVEMNPYLYPDVQGLRQAVKLFLFEPEAFDREQQKLAKKDAAIPKNMEAEIAALSDDD